MLPMLSHFCASKYDASSSPFVILSGELEGSEILFEIKYIYIYINTMLDLVGGIRNIWV